MGSEADTGVPDSKVEEIVYNCYFNVEQSIEEIMSAYHRQLHAPFILLTSPLEEVDRRDAAKARIGEP